MNKAMLGFLIAVLVTIAAAKFAYNVRVDQGVEPGNEAWAHSKMEFVTWNKQKWTTWIHDGVFEQAPQNTSNWSRHSNASIAFTDWDGELWQAKIDGDVFLLAYRGNWNGPVERSEGIRYRDWSGDKQIRTIADIRR
jgi:hypothetical protein